MVVRLDAVVRRRLTPARQVGVDLIIGNGVFVDLLPARLDERVNVAAGEPPAVFCSGAADDAFGCPPLDSLGVHAEAEFIRDGLSVVSSSRLHAEACAFRNVGTNLTTR